MCSYMKHTISKLTRSCRLTAWSRKASDETLSALKMKKTNLILFVRGTSRTLESYNAGVGREGLIWVWTVSVGEIIIRFERLQGKFILSHCYFHYIYRQLCVIPRWFPVKWSWPSQVVLHYTSLLCITVSNQTSARAPTVVAFSLWS